MSDTLLLAFTVPGSPVPKARSSHHGRKRRADLKTDAYELHVAQCAINAAVGRFRTLANLIIKSQWFVDCRIYVADKRARDADNIIKSIADGLVKSGLFDCDTGWRMLPRPMSYELDRERPRVEVEIRHVTS